MPRGQDTPQEFRTALDSLAQQRLRSEVDLREIPAPKRVAPYAVALAATVEDENEELSSGRLVVLYDPAGQDEWRGRFRVVAFVQAMLEPEIAGDDLAAEVAWTWLEDALEAAGATAGVLGGTVTRTLSKTFGAISDRPDDIDIEIRASWTPQGPHLGPHLTAWAELLATAAGLPPIIDGVTALPGRRNGHHR